MICAYRCQKNVRQLPVREKMSEHFEKFIEISVCPISDIFTFIWGPFSDIFHFFGPIAAISTLYGPFSDIFHFA